MRKVLLSIVGALCVLCGSPAFATWSLVQVKNSVNCTSPCAVTVTSTVAGNALVAGLLDSNTTRTISAVTAGACATTWTHAPNTPISAAGEGSGDLFYCTSATGGSTSISITSSAACSNCVAVIWEANSTLGSIAIDSGADPSDKVTDTTCTACAGTTLTLSNNNKFVAMLAACGGSCSNLSGTGCTNDLGSPDGDGVGHCIISTSGSVTLPTTWTQTSGALIANAVALQESGGGAVAHTAVPYIASIIREFR